MVYLYDACDQISDFCHQQLLRKMRRKISWTDGQTDRGKTVYPSPPSGSRGIIKYSYFLKESQFFKHNCFRVIFFSWHFFVFLFFLEQDLNLTWSVHCSTYSLSIMMNHLSPLARSIKLWIIIHTHTHTCIIVLPSTGLEPTPLIHYSTNHSALFPAASTTRSHLLYKL